MQQGIRFSNRLLLLFSFVVFLLFLFYRIVFIFYSHPNAAGIDNNIVYFIQRILNGNDLYTNPAETPFSVAQYSPLYYYATAALCRLTGTGPDDVLRIFEISKLFSLVLNLLLSGIIFFIAKRIFSLSNKTAGFLALLTFIFIESNSFARPDSLEHLFFFLALYFFFLALKKTGNGTSHTKELVMSAIIAVLAFLSKQSAITLPVICFLWLLKGRYNKKDLFIYTASYVLAMSIVIVILQFFSGIKPMFQNTVLGLDNGFNPGSYWVDIIVYFYGSYGYLWVLVFFILFFLLRKEKDGILRFLAFALLLQFILTNLFALKYGSTSNYFTNWWTMLFIGMGIYWHKLAVGLEKINRLLPVILLLFFLGLKAALILQPLTEKTRTMDERRAFFYTEKEIALHILSQYETANKAKIFCNLFSPDTYFNNIMFRQAIVPQYDVVSLASYPRKVYDYARLRKMLSDGSVQLMITKRNTNPLWFMDIDLSPYYVLAETIGEYRVYRYSKTANRSE